MKKKNLSKIAWVVYSVIFIAAALWVGLSFMEASVHGLDTEHSYSAWNLLALLKQYYM